MNRKQGLRVLIFMVALVFLCATRMADAQTYSVLYNFGANTGDPEYLQSGLVQGPDGALYGGSPNGGAYGYGSIFKLTTAGKMQTLYSFCAQSGCPDGANPYTTLTLRPDGHFLGATLAGGKLSLGTLFDITATGTFTLLYSFPGGNQASAPLSSPILGPDGNFYGVAGGGVGNCGGNCGVAYRFTPSPAGTGGVFKILHNFNSQGYAPTDLTLGTDGNLYGTTPFGGTLGYGIAYRLTRNNSMTVLHNFDTVDGYPCKLIVGRDGSLYGTTEGNGMSPSNGTIFQLTPAGTYAVLHRLTGTDGIDPFARLVEASDGNFYGTTLRGGANTNPNCSNGCGTLFKVTPAGVFTILYNFDFPTGSYAQPEMFQHTNGLIYAPTNSGGTFSEGVLYSLNNTLPRFVMAVPAQSKAGGPVEILGEGFTASTSVRFNGMPATVKVSSATRLLATVPRGATTGYLKVTTSAGTMSSKEPFVVVP